MCHFRYLWNGMCDRHRAEITVMQLTGHSFPVDHFVTPLWEFCLPYLILLAKLYFTEWRERAWEIRASGVTWWWWWWLWDNCGIIQFEFSNSDQTFNADLYSQSCNKCVKLLEKRATICKNHARIFLWNFAGLFDPIHLIHQILHQLFAIFLFLYKMHWMNKKNFSTISGENVSGKLLVFETTWIFYTRGIDKQLKNSKGWFKIMTIDWLKLNHS